MAASSQIGNIDQAFFSLFNLLCKNVRFEAFLGPVRVSPGRHPKTVVPVIISKVLATGLLT